MNADEMDALARAQPNPFAGSVLRNGFEQPASDVPEIHAQERERLRASVEDLRRSGNLALQIITGEPGDGKTHLLASLRAEAESSWLIPGSERVMVPIEPLRDPDAPFGHILRGLSNGLMRPLAAVPKDGAAPATPLEHILWRILRRATTRLAQAHPACAEVAALLTSNDLSRYPGTARVLLQDRWNELEEVLVREGQRLPELAPDKVDPEVWSVVCRFPRQPLALRWLAGYSLAEEDLKALGVSQPLDGEERAYRGLSSLLQMTDVPIVLGFDQLEGVTRLGNDAIANFLQAIGDQLYTGGGRALVLLFCQADAWSQFAGRLQAQTRDRLLEQPILHLRALSPQLGERLIEKRLASMWAGLSIQPPHSTFPYPEGFVRKTIIDQNLRGPRRVLSYFTALGLGTSAKAPRAPRAPREIARGEFARLREELARDGEASPEEAAAIAQSAMKSILERAGTLDGKRIGTVEGGSGLRFKVASQSIETSIYAEASNSRHGMAGKAVVKRLKGALDSGEADRALLLRSDKIPLPAGAEKSLRELGARAAIVRVADEETVSFAAVEKLLNQAASRDIEIPIEEARAFVLEEIAPSLAVVRAFLDAAVGGKGADSRPSVHSNAGLPVPAAVATAHESLVLSAITRKPWVASEAQLAKALQLEPEQVARTTDELERRGEATVLRGKDGDRTVLRRPR